MSKECPNCEFEVAPNFEYCPQCGQKANLHRLSLHDVLHDALHYFIHTDKGFIRLLKELIFKTGIVAKEYVSGKRKKYFPPLNFFLLVATIYVLISSMVAFHSPANALKGHPEINTIHDPVQEKYQLQIYERQERALHFINKFSNIIAMAAVPLICLIYWICYIQGTYNYTEHLAGCMYMVGFTNLIYAVILVPISLLMGVKQFNSSFPLALIFMIFQIIYNSIFYYRFIGNYSNASLAKAIAVSSLAVLFWFGFSGFLVAVYITNGFWGIVR